MKLLINGVIYDSTKVPVTIVFDENEEKLFNGMQFFVSAPEHFTEEQRQSLMEKLCFHRHIERYNHGYHAVCRDCGKNMD